MGTEEDKPDTTFPAEVLTATELVEWLCRAAKIWGKDSPNAWEKARVKSCWERTNDGAEVPETGAVTGNELSPEDEEAVEEGRVESVESNMTAKLLLVPRPAICAIQTKKPTKSEE